MVHILSFINNVSGNCQKFTTIVYAKINQGILKKVFESMIMTEKIHVHHISYKDIKNVCPLFEPSYNTKAQNGMK